MSKHNTEIRIADWKTEKDSLKQIRQTVFIEEQKVPVELEWDEFDDSSTHFIATLEGQHIACARLKPDGQIGRMAVLAEHRNQGAGSKLLQFILRTAGRQKTCNVYLHAQVSAVLFYEKHGFTTTGDIFYEANIPHREMLRKIC
ncbi:MAG: GNAT family N-acetyltransferase [Gammaproteobacteria bacterium]|nr:GNAT family N-acetyltransferase [Gammaproteobacteria bacterium]